MKHRIMLGCLLSLAVLLISCSQGSPQLEEQTRNAVVERPIERITVQQVKERLDKGLAVTFIDSRTGSAWTNAETMIPEAIHVGSNEQLKQLIDDLPKESFVVTYCT